MRILVLAACWLTALAGEAAAQPVAQQVAVSSCTRTETDGSRALCHEAVLPASAHDIWMLFATSEGLRSWLAPVAAIDLRIGGMWEASYDASARLGDPGNIRNRIMSYLPERMLSIQVANAPPGFPHAERVAELWTVIELEPVSAGETRVRVSMLGYGEGEADDALWRMFDAGNAYTLQKLGERVGERR
ncbi:SRPBCC domain-containing protein [Terricaulis sp.]|uniref:SRPBCC domain-containing protein n=1 Tax=Terricaulis sp. TaxID=2768686 RepID=UPI0037833FB9